MIRFKRIGTTIGLVWNLLSAMVLLIFTLMIIAYPVYHFVHGACEWLLRRNLDTEFIMLTWQLTALIGSAVSHLMVLLCQIGGRIIPRAACALPALPGLFYLLLVSPVPMYDLSSPATILFLTAFFALIALWIIGDVWALAAIWEKGKKGMADHWENDYDRRKS